MRMYDLIKGNIYRYTWPGNEKGDILRFIDRTNSPNIYREVNPPRWNHKSSYGFEHEFHEPTPLEKYWFELCEQADALVPEPTRLREEITNIYPMY